MASKDLEIFTNLIGKITHHACRAQTEYGKGIIDGFREILPTVPADRFDKIPEGILYQLDPISLLHEHDEVVRDLYFKKGTLMDQKKSISAFERKLGEGILSAIQESGSIAKLLEAIGTEGFDVVLAIEASIRLVPLEKNDSEATPPEPSSFPFPSDKDFLSHLKIRNLEEDSSPPE
jgi:hypothetical protein